MYPIVPCKAQDARHLGLSWATTFIPGGDRGFLLKLNDPSIWAKADNFGLIRLWQRRFNGISATRSN